MRTFFISYAVLCAIAFLGILLIYVTKGVGNGLIDFSSSLAYFMVITPLVFLFVNSGLKGGNNYTFFNYFYAAFGVKMFLSVLFALVYILGTGHKGLSFGLSFGGLYLAFTGIETFALVLASQAAAALHKAKQI